MKIPRSFLEEFISLPPELSYDGLKEKLTLSGLEVEEENLSHGETVWTLNVTPNRGDCLSIFGVAREVSVLTNTPIRQKKTKSEGKLKFVANHSQMSLDRSGKEVEEKCPYYLLTIIRGVKIAPSSPLIQKRLEQMGLRPINNIVDATNYVQMEYGQPTHAFDLSKIKSHKILIRSATAGEKCKTLDGIERVLTTDDLLITDGTNPLALAGVMGCENSGVDDSTHDIVLECAFFEPRTVRKTARRLGIQTESSYRFERHINPDIQPALLRLVDLILETSGGSWDGQVLALGKSMTEKDKHQKTEILFNPQKVAEILGNPDYWTPARSKDILIHLGFQLEATASLSTWKVFVPGYRSDVTQEADLLEEIARVGGYENIPSEFPRLLHLPMQGGRDIRPERELKRVLTSLGFQEVIHFSFGSPDDFEKLGFVSDEGIHLDNPLGQEFSCLRPTLLPSLLNHAAHHQRNQMEIVRSFELRRTFKRIDGQIIEEKKLALVLSGSSLSQHWSLTGVQKGIQSSLFYDLKGVVEVLGQTFGLVFSYKKSNTSYFHPGKQVEILLDGEVIGGLGEIHPEVMKRFDLEKNTLTLEIKWEIVENRISSIKRKFVPFGTFPVVQRDLALVMAQDVLAGDLARDMKAVDDVIQEVTVFDVYQGPGVEEGKKSVAYALKLNSLDHTLKDDEIKSVLEKVVETIKRKYEVSSR